MVCTLITCNVIVNVGIIMNALNTMPYSICMRFVLYLTCGNKDIERLRY